MCGSKLLLERKEREDAKSNNKPKDEVREVRKYEVLYQGSRITHDYDFGNCTPEEVEENLMKGSYDNYDYFKGYSQVKCSSCEDVIIDLG